MPRGARLNTMDDFHGNYQPVTESGCWIWTGNVTVSGYGAFTISHKAHRAHRLSFEVYKGKIPDGLCVCHTCDVRCCVNPDHLFLGTQKENISDMDAKGRRGVSSQRGESNGFSKLSDKEVRVIFSSNKSIRELQDEFSVSNETIRKIKRSITWKHITEEE